MNKILFVDILSTGLSPQKCGIYAIGGILCEDSPSVIKEVRRFEFRIRPFEGARIMDNSLWLGGVTRSQLLYYHKDDEVLKELMDVLEGFVKIQDPEDKVFICGFNSAAFELPFLKEWFDRNGNKRFRDCFHMQAIDLLSISAFALMERRTEMREFNLSSAARKLGVMPIAGNSYSCIDNAETCLHIYRRLKDKLNKGEYGSHEKTTEMIQNFKKKDI